MGDNGRIRQILINLAGNAVKFTKEGSVSIRVEVESSSGNEHRVRVLVQDTGIGIPAERLDPLFDRFVQADSSTSREYGGTGLGLAICRQLVELMNGSLGVRSEPDVGSCFHFVLPLQADRTSKDSPGSRDTAPLRFNGRVLVVDDDKVNRKVAMALLANLGCQTDAVSSGREAVKAVKSVPYDLVLMDCQMPEMDGFKATRLIRSQEPAGVHIPIVALTAAAMQGDRENCLAAGMDHYLSKPIDIAKLREVLGNFIQPA